MIRILLIEDDRTFSSLIQDVLAIHEIQVDVLHHAADVLNVVQETCPDLVVVDLALPEIDGLTVIEMLRNHSTVTNIPIIVATALGSVEARQRAQAAGADLFMMKPFSIDDLVQHIRSYAVRSS